MTSSALRREIKFKDVVRVVYVKYEDVTGPVHVVDIYKGRFVIAQQQIAFSSVKVLGCTCTCTRILVSVTKHVISSM